MTTDLTIRVRRNGHIVESATPVRRSIAHSEPAESLTWTKDTGWATDGEPVQPNWSGEIAVTKDGHYWVTGKIKVKGSGGQYLETRNRVMLCRCGQSKSKSLYDGMDKKTGFPVG